MLHSIFVDEKGGYSQDHEAPSWPEAMPSLLRCSTFGDDVRMELRDAEDVQLVKLQRQIETLSAFNRRNLAIAAARLVEQKRRTMQRKQAQTPSQTSMQRFMLSVLPLRVPWPTCSSS